MFNFIKKIFSRNIKQSEDLSFKENDEAGINNFLGRSIKSKQINEKTHRKLKFTEPEMIEYLSENTSYSKSELIELIKIDRSKVLDMFMKN